MLHLSFLLCDGLGTGTDVVGIVCKVTKGKYKGQTQLHLGLGSHDLAGLSC